MSNKWRDDPDETASKAVLRALSDEGANWRTMGGIARQAALTEAQVALVLVYNAQFVEFSDQSASGSPLVRLVEVFS